MKFGLLAQIMQGFSSQPWDGSASGNSGELFNRADASSAQLLALALALVQLEIQALARVPAQALTRVQVRNQTRTGSTGLPEGCPL